MAWVIPPSSPVYATSPITNGGFDGSSGWTIVQNGGSGMSFNSELRFSYATGEVSQAFNVNQGDALEVSFTVDNSIQNSIGQGAVADTWNASLTSGHNSTEIGRIVAHEQETFTLSLTVPVGATSATIGFSGIDNGFWAGVYGPVVDNVSVTVTPAVTSLVVTSLADDGSEGTLRWAINQANGTSGGIYDTITFAVEGTITLTSNLPSITQSLSITGSGMTSTIVDGNGQYRSIYNNGTRNISISNMTFKRGANATGGIVWTNNGTFTVTNVKFTDSQNYAWYQQNNTVTTFESCQFTNLAYGIRSDYGSTPSVKSDDSAYSDRIYINNSQFLNNSYGLATERFVRINNSTFSNNVVAAQMQGLNRIQVYNSTFNDNGTAIYVFSWIPTSWTPGVDNQVVGGNTFNNNSTAITFNNYFSNGSRTVNGNDSNSWSTSRNNSFSDNATIYGGNGFVEDSNTVVTTTTSTSTTSTTTTEPETTTTEPETTTTEPESVTTVPYTTTTVPESPPPGTTTTSIVPSEEDTTVETPTIPSETQGNESTSSLPQYATEDETETTVPEVTEATEAVDNIDTENLSDTALVSAVNDVLDLVTNAEGFGSVVNDILDKPLTDEQFASVVDEVFASDVTNEQFAAAVDAVFDEPLSDEQFASVIDAILDEPLSPEQLDSVIDALGSDNVSEEQTQEAIDAIAEDGLSQDEAISIATDAEVLEKITEDQAVEIFDAIDVEELTDEAAQEIVDAVQNAPEEVRAAFEEEIDVFSGGFDSYVPTGSSVSVETRRIIVAASSVLVAAPSIAGGAASGGSGGSPASGGSSGGGGGSSGEAASEKKDSSRRRRSSR